MGSYVVLGSNSPTGSHIIDNLLQTTDENVIGISRSPEYHEMFLPYKYKKQVSNKFSFHQLDINKDTTKIIHLLDEQQPHTIINLMAQGEVHHSWDHPEHWFQTNAIGITKLTNAIKEKPYLKRFTQISTPEVYGAKEGKFTEDLSHFNPSTPYAASKGAGDLFLNTLAKNFDFPLITIRSATVYGPHQQLYRIIPRTIIYLKMGKKIPLHGGGHAMRAFIHLRDVAQGIITATQTGNPKELYHFSPNNDGIKIRDLVRTICEQMNKNFDECTESVGDRIGQDAHYVLDAQKARSQLAWEEKENFESAIKETIQWIDDNWEHVQTLPLEYVHKE